MKLYIIFILLFFLISGCGSKKSISQSERKENTDISLIDTSTIVKRIELEKQYIDTHTKERIVTYYGVRFDTVFVDGKPVITPTPYPLKKEEERDIQKQNHLWKIKVQDSIRNAINLTYRNNIDEKSKRVLELKESIIIWQIAFLIASIAGLIFLILFMRNKKFR